MPPKHVKRVHHLCKINLCESFVANCLHALSKLNMSKRPSSAAQGIGITKTEDWSREDLATQSCTFAILDVILLTGGGNCTFCAFLISNDKNDLLI